MRGTAYPSNQLPVHANRRLTLPTHRLAIKKQAQKPHTVDRLIHSHLKGKERTLSALHRTLGQQQKRASHTKLRTSDEAPECTNYQFGLSGVHCHSPWVAPFQHGTREYELTKGVDAHMPEAVSQLRHAFDTFAF